MLGFGQEAGIKYIYKAPEYPSSKSPKQSLFLKLISYLAIATIFFSLGILVGKNQLTKNNQPGPFIPSITFQAISKGAVAKNEETTIFHNGRLIYSNKVNREEFETTISSTEVSNLVSAITQSGFFGLNDNYSANCPDCLTYIITLKLSPKQQKTIKTEWGARQEPAALKPLILSYEQLILRLKQEGYIRP